MKAEGGSYYRGQFIVNHCRLFLPEISEETQSLFRTRVSKFVKQNVAKSGIALG